MKAKFKNMDEVFRKADAEKAAQQQAFERLHSQDSPEKIAQYTVASAHEEKFDASVNGHKVEVEWEKNKKDNTDKTHKHKKPGLGIVRGTVSGLVGFGLSAGTSILGNEALNNTGIPRAMEAAIHTTYGSIERGVSERMRYNEYAKE